MRQWPAVNRAATSLVGGLLGVGLGLLTTSPLAALLNTTSVTWPASNCAAGIYTITALARNVNDSRAYTTTLNNVSLPKESVTVQFSNIPAGSYRVSATSIGNNGKRYGADERTVTGAGDAGFPSRTRPPGAPAVGRARSRFAPEPPPPPPRRSPLTTPKQTAPAEPAGRSASAGGLVYAPIEEAALERWLRLLLSQLADVASSAGGESIWQSIDILDSDADGAIDFITVRLIGGDVWVLRIARN